MSSPQVWLELDNLLDPDGERGEGAPAALMTDADMPAELLALLPPPPEAGWPESFGLQALANSLTTRARLEALVVGGDGRATGGTFAAVGDEYPLLRRAARLSYAVWAVIGAQDGAPLQRVLETTSTAERLRFAVLRIRRMTGRSFRVRP